MVDILDSFGLTPIGQSFDGNGNARFEGATRATYSVLQHGTERQRVLMYRAGEEMAIYSKKKEFEYISTSVSTSRDIGGRSTAGWGFERLEGFIAKRWYVR